VEGFDPNALRLQLRAEDPSDAVRGVQMTSSVRPVGEGSAQRCFSRGERLGADTTAL